MLTADPEGFPLGLAELGLKKPKAGVENTQRVTTEMESKPSTRRRHKEGRKGLWPEARARDGPWISWMENNHRPKTAQNAEW